MQNIEIPENFPFNVKEISIKGKNNARIYFLNENFEGECIAIERMVILDNEKTMLKTVVCGGLGIPSEY